MLAIFVVLLIPGWFFAGDLLHFMQEYALHVFENSQQKLDLSYFALMEPFMVELKAGMLIAFAAGLPLYFWRFWKFLAPALYRKEKCWILGCSIAAWGLFFCGFALGIFGVMPLLVRFSLDFARDGLIPVIGLSNFIGLAMSVALAFGAMFELPLVLFALMAVRVLDVETVSKQRPVAAVIILFLAALLTPPDVVSQLMLGLPTYLLFELTLLAAKLFIKPLPEDRGEIIPATELQTDAEEYKNCTADYPYETDNTLYNCYHRRKRRTNGALPRRKNRNRG